LNIARHIMSSVVSFRDSNTGGYQFLSSTGKQLLDVERTGAALMGAVWSQNLSEARSAASFLQLALQRQPKPDREFHAYLDLSGKVAPDTHHVDPGRLLLATKLGWSALMLRAQGNQPELDFLAIQCASSLIERQSQDGSINFDQVPDISKPIDKLWLIGWGCDCALTLMAVADRIA
jgi:hypothetical protein